MNKLELAKIPKIIETLGCKLVSKHQTQDWIKSEAKLTNTEIHDRDYDWEIESDCGIFEISNPSLGVGAEISDMITFKKPILCLFKKGLEKEVSAYIQGKKGSKYIKSIFECNSYESLEDLKNIIQKFVNSI